MKIAVLGNSHIGALRTGWDLIKSDYGSSAEIVFFGHRGNGMEGLRIGHRRGRLFPDNSKLKEALRFTSGGQTSINPADFETILLYGLSVQPFFLGSEEFYSKNVIRLALKDTVERSVGFKLLNRLRKICQTPIYAGHDPLPMATGPVRKGDIASYLAGIELANNEIYAPKMAELLPQSAETIVNGNKTDPKYSKGSRRLAIGDEFDDKLQPVNEQYHTNDVFGALFLKAFLAKLDRVGANSIAGNALRYAISDAAPTRAFGAQRRVPANTGRARLTPR